MQSGTAKQTARWVALTALFLLPLTPLIVASSFFFPFITGKAFYLRILIEVAVVAWVVLALLDKAYRPRFSWLGASVVAFVVWMFIADAFAPNATKAFWSNFERMEGWVLLAHLLGLFFAASNILRVEKKWREWFLTSLGVAVVLVGYALLQLNGSLTIHQGSTRIDASLGNSAYFAIYLLFTTFVAGWLALTERRAWLKWSLLALAAVTAVLIFYTGTRGTIIGLVLGLSLSALLMALTAGSHARRVAAGACALILILAGSFYLARDSSFVQKNYALERVASISLADGETRFTIWHMAWQGFLERPVVGWGQEGFNYVFNKYYDPSLYAQEVWFDRAHNAFIDWLSAGGLPAFLLYISLFVSAIVLLWRRSEFSRPERILLTAALVGYAVHNVFVFDNLYSYIYFFAILALIDSQAARPIEQLEKAPELDAELGVTYALPVAAVVLFALVWFVNVPGMRAAGELVRAISPQMSVNVFEIATTNFWPNDPESHIMLAGAYYATGRPADAISQLQAAEKLASQDAVGDSMKSKSETLIKEVTEIGTGEGVPAHAEYFIEAMQSIKKKASVLISNLARQLQNAEQAAKAIAPKHDADADTLVANLKASISVLDELTGDAAVTLAQEVKNEKPKGLLRNLVLFQDLVQHPSFAAQEMREQLISFAGGVVQSTTVTNEVKQKVVTLAIEEMQKQVEKYPADARVRLQLAYGYRIVSDTKSALEQIRIAISLSPRKEQMWLEAGQTEWEAGNLKQVQIDFNTAYELGPQFTNLATYAAVGNIVAGDLARADAVLMKTYGTTVVDSDILSIAYLRTKSWPRLIALWQLRSEKPGASAQTWFGLAAAYYAAGDKENTIKIIRKVVELFPNVAAAGAEALKQIEGK